jgi:H+/Cl- antiporter ClcA
MRAKLRESSRRFLNIIKWVFLASLVGIVVGFATTAFLAALDKATGLTAGHSYYFLMLPAAFLVSTMVIKRLAPEARGHGTEKVIEAIHQRSGKIDPLVVPVKLVATVLTIASGGSAGKEGPCAQIGAGLSSLLADLFRFGDGDRKKLVICGISAGFSTVFGTPIAGAIFGVEVLFVGSLLYEVLLPSFVAGIVGYQVSSALGVAYFQEPLNFIPYFTGIYFLRVCLAGVFFGLCALLFIEMLRFAEWVRKRIPWSDAAKAVLGGSTLVVLALVFSTRYLGLGLPTIQAALEGHEVPLPAFLLKMLFTTVTLTMGGSGGIVTPIFFIGSTAGTAFASIFGMSPYVFSAIGMVSLLAGAAKTPVSASIMAMEIFGPPAGPYAAVACVISYLMSGYRSVYPSQILPVEPPPTPQAQGREMNGNP